MQTIIFADRKPFGSDPISQQYCPALLSLGGKSTLVHAIEDVAGAGIEKIYLVISSQAFQIESLLGDGTRWGIQIEYLLSRGEEKPSEIINRYRDQFDSSLLLVRGDMIRSACIKEFLASGADQDYSSAAYIQQQPAGVVLCHELSEAHVIDLLHFENIRHDADHTVAKIELADKSVSYLDELPTFFDTSISLCNGRFSGISSLGLKTESGLVHGRNKKISPRASIQGDIWLGNNVSIEDDVEIIGPVVIGDDVLIDNGARLQNSVVLPDTYLGKGVSLENSLLSKSYIYRQDIGIGLPITDDFLASALAFNGAPLTDRVLATLLFILSAPLWIYAALLAVLNTPRSLFSSISIHANGPQISDSRSSQPRSTKALEWNISSPLLRRLPWLLNVIKGDIRLIGTSPLIQPAQTEDELFGHTATAYGLLSTSQIDFNIEVSQSDRAMNDMVYDKQRSFMSDVRYLIAFTRCLFGPNRGNRKTASHSSSI